MAKADADNGRAKEREAELIRRDTEINEMISQSRRQRSVQERQAGASNARSSTSENKPSSAPVGDSKRDGGEPKSHIERRRIEREMQADRSRYRHDQKKAELRRRQQKEEVAKASAEKQEESPASSDRSGSKDVAEPAAAAEEAKQEQEEDPQPSTRFRVRPRSKRDQLDSILGSVRKNDMRRQSKAPMAKKQAPIDRLAQQAAQIRARQNDRAIQRMRRNPATRNRRRPAGSGDESGSGSSSSRRSSPPPSRRPSIPRPSDVPPIPSRPLVARGRATSAPRPGARLRSSPPTRQQWDWESRPVGRAADDESAFVADSAVAAHFDALTYSQAFNLPGSKSAKDILADRVARAGSSRNTRDADYANFDGQDERADVESDDDAEELPGYASPNTQGGRTFDPPVEYRTKTFPGEETKSRDSDLDDDESDEEILGVSCFQVMHEPNPEQSGDESEGQELVGVSSFKPTNDVSDDESYGEEKTADDRSDAPWRSLSSSTLNRLRDAHESDKETRERCKMRSRLKKTKFKFKIIIRIVLAITSRASMVN